MTYTPHCIYLMRNEWSDSNFKIGVSNAPDRRCIEVQEQYQNVSPIVETLAWFPSRRFAYQAETLWHRFHSDHRTDDQGGNEWFSLDLSSVEQFNHWASHSKTLNEMRSWLFAKGASKPDVLTYSKKLLKSVPRPRRFRRSVETWFNPEYCFN